MVGALVAIGVAMVSACSAAVEAPASEAPADAGRYRRPAPTGPADDEPPACRASTDEDIPVPAPYAGRSNPLSRGGAELSRGRSAYATSCGDCHGTTGSGDGHRAPAQRIPPTDFTRRLRPDDYLFWRISEGGGPPFCSSMPVGKAFFTEERRWELVLVLHELAAARDAGAEGGL